MSSISVPVTLTAKPHALYGAVLTPKHAREMTPSLCLAISSALAEQSQSSAAARGALPHSGASAAFRKPPSPTSSSSMPGVQYTVWITEAWKVLGWAEPSAALFWEMATMYHTLHVAARSVEVKTGGEGLDGAGIPPILSCGSASSVGSGKSLEKKGLLLGSDRPSSPVPGFTDAKSTVSQKSAQGGGVGAPKTASASAKELPVWLVGMFLLLHCEEEAFLRNVSGEDERRFNGGKGDMLNPLAAAAAHNSPGGVDFSALLMHPSLSPRTRIHAAPTDNSHCTAYLLRHLRKFLLLSAVPHNPDAVWAVTTLADHKSSDPEYTDYRQNPNARPGGSLLFLTQPRPKPNAHQIRLRHEEEHGNIGLDVRLLPEDLERLNVVLQAPSGGLIDDPPLRIGDYLQSIVAASGGSIIGGITVEDAERELRKHLELELLLAGQETSVNDQDDDESCEVMANLSLNDDMASPRDGPHSPINGIGSSGRTGTQKDASCSNDGAAKQQQSADLRGSNAGHDYHKELSYTNLRATTILLKPNSHPDNQNIPLSTTSQSFDSPGATSPTHSGNREYVSNGRLHDLHVSECSDAHMYLLQPFEHATIAACTGCTIVVGAVAGLLHVVDCERTTVTSAARRVLVGNCFEVTHFIFSPSPPLLVGDNRSCQFAPYNTYYDGLREDLLATGLAAAVMSQSSDERSPHGPALQCASNKWKLPVELAKLEIPQVPKSLSASPPGTPVSDRISSEDKALSKSSGSDDAMQTPVILPPSEFHILLVPIETETAKQRRLKQEEAAALLSSPSSISFDEVQVAMSKSGDGDVVFGGPESQNHGGKPNNGPAAEKGTPLESEYCRNLADVLQLSPFALPSDYERRALVKADRIRSIQQAMQKNLTPEQQISLEEELNRGFRDWLVTSGNLRQVLDLVHMERKNSGL